jgi:hypothetical protein
MLQAAKQIDFGASSHPFNILITPHGMSKRITADSEYDKAEFRAFCDSIGCKLAIVTTEALSPERHNRSGKSSVKNVLQAHQSF